MSHERRKDDPHGCHAFICDGCGMVAGQHDQESAALAQAHDTVFTRDWRAGHPGWVFWCPWCGANDREEKT